MKKSLASVKRDYEKLIQDVKTKDYYTGIDLTNRVNCYVCKNCGHATKTKDIDAGVTPFAFECEICGKDAYSTFYKDIIPNQQPTIEWYRPTLEQVLRLRNKPNLLDHILMGGLDYRYINR